jgi:hypothetical protein
MWKYEKYNKDITNINMNVITTEQHLHYIAVKGVDRMFQCVDGAKVWKVGSKTGERN